jgi:glycosyltransferase involved in cell wall biosynthesis
MARLVPSKRHKEMFSVVKRLVEEGIDCKMICLGTGSLENELRQIIDISGMKNHIFLLGRKENIFDYIAACDVFFHLSSAEASNSAVKEVALYQKPVIVCKGVGDFEDYIIPWENGFLVDKENPVEESHSILKAIAENKVDRSKLGQRLFNTVTTMFDIKNVSEDYNRLLHYVMQQ